MITENQLALFNQRDKQGIDAVFTDLHNDLYLYITIKINNETVAGEMTSDVFMALLDAEEIFDKVENLNAYLYHLAKNRCINFLIAQKRQRARMKGLMAQNNDDDNSDPQIPNDMQVLSAVTTIITQLPGKYGQVARYLHNNFTYQQIADMMNISLDMVYKLRDHAVKRIRQRLRGI
jgi:RNA polymerase sigma-70 factor (ECF subfamily)